MSPSKLMATSQCRVLATVPYSSFVFFNATPGSLPLIDGFG